MSEHPSGEWLPGLEEPEEVGRGGFGIVYSALQTDLGRTVAVKVLSGQLDDLALQRFDRERKAMGALSAHPNIVTIYSSGLTQDDRPYIVMEYLPGGSMGERLEESGSLEWVEAVDVGVLLASALETAHRAGVLHRDLKPENIFVSSLGAPKIGDFGIARVEGAPQTQSAMITASIAHAAPELVDGKPPSVQSDIYGLASTVVTLIMGSPPFTRPTDESIVPILNRIVSEPLPDLRQRGVPNPVCDALEQAMAKERGERFGSVEAFGRALQEAQRRSDVPVTPLLIQGADPTVPRGSGAPTSEAVTDEAAPSPSPPSAPGSVTIVTGETPPPPGSVSGDAPPPPGSVSGDAPPPPGSGRPTAPPPVAGSVSGELPGPVSGAPDTSRGPGIWWFVGGVALLLLLLLLLLGAIVRNRDDGATDATTTSANPTTTETTEGTTVATTDIPFALGDDPDLDVLVEDCAGGDLESCDLLYFQSPVGTNYESYGDTCGGRATEGLTGRCESELGS